LHITPSKRVIQPRQFLNCNVPDGIIKKGFIEAYVMGTTLH
jgi:hypothetical protein